MFHNYLSILKLEDDTVGKTPLHLPRGVEFFAAVCLPSGRFGGGHYPSLRKSSASNISSFVACWSMRMSPMPPSSVKLMMPPEFFLS